MDIKIRKRPSNKTSPSTSLLKAVNILQCFSYDEPELGIADITRKVELPRTTVHRILSTLLQTRLLERDINSGKYRIGPSLYMMGSLYLGTTDILTAAEPVTKLLNELTGEYVKLSVFDRGNVVVIKKEESRHGFRYYHTVGTILPAYASAMGKAFLSQLSESELDSYYPGENFKLLTSKTIATKTQLKKELEQIRTTGVSYDFEGNTEGLVGIASIIRGASGKAVSAICTGISTYNMDEKRLQKLSELAKIGASLISYRLGYHDDKKTVRNLEEIHAWWEKAAKDINCHKQIEQRG
jgi:DNA-binding IclR family transcriptional regulator